jgi:flagellar hook-length control protein FliK
VAAPAAAQAGPAQAAGQPSPPGAHGHHTAVLDQVLPVVPRLVARGDGTQRLTLKLHPEDLGEVHLTVTVRKNTVDVTLAAGSAAQDALRDGSSHLRALLDAAGHTTGQVVVRDLPQSASPGQAQPNGGQGGPGQGGAGQGGASPQAFADGSGARGQQSTQGQGRPGTPRQPVAGDPGGTAPTPRSVGTPGTTTLDLRI